MRWLVLIRGLKNTRRFGAAEPFSRVWILRETCYWTPDASFEGRRSLSCVHSRTALTGARYLSDTVFGALPDEPSASSQTNNLRLAIFVASS